MKAQVVAELKRKKLLYEQREHQERIELTMDLPGISLQLKGRLACSPWHDPESAVVRGSHTIET